MTLDQKFKDDHKKINKHNLWILGDGLYICKKKQICGDGKRVLKSDSFHNCSLKSSKEAPI